MAKKRKRLAAPPPPAFVPEWRQAKQVGPTPQPPRKAAGAVSPDWWRRAPTPTPLTSLPGAGIQWGEQGATNPYWWQQPTPTRQYPSYLGMPNPYAGTTRYGPTAGNLYPSVLGQGTVGAQVPGMNLPFSQYGVSYGPGGIPIPGRQGTPLQTPQALTYLPRTPVEQALADVGQLAAGGGGQPAQEAGGGGSPYAGAFPGYWEAMGQRPGNYPVPQGAIAGMPDWRSQWEDWSWSTRGIPLQGNEIFSISRGGSPWGGPWGSSWGGGGGGREEPPPEPQWNPPASQGTF